jgi:hypothetical protein
MAKFCLTLIRSLLLVGLLFTQSCNYFKRDICYENPSDLLYLKHLSCLKTEVIERNLEDLFRIHALLLNESIVAVLNDECENLKAVKTNFLVNTQEIAGFFEDVYTPAVACRIKQFISQQIHLHFNYIYALKTYNKATAHQLALKRRHQGDLFIEFLGINNPYFSKSAESPVMEEHLLLTMELTLAYFRNEMDEVDRLYPRLLEQMEEFSRHLIRAIEKQMEDEC